MQPGCNGPNRPSQPGRTNHTHHRRRPDLILPHIPARDASLAVPLPLPPLSGPGPSASSSPALADLERLRRVGSGTAGTVWLVRHRPTSRLYALKVIHGHHEDHVRRQMCREIDILRAADSPSVVRCHGFYERGGEIQILLEYMDGGSLAGRRFATEGQLADVARQVLEGLAYLHGRRIMHRDIKPANLLTDRRGQVKIADFGVGLILAETMDCNSAVGTIAYSSPERIDTNDKGGYDGRAGDIWSFGVSILEFYLGRFPFGTRVEDFASLMVAICLAPLPEAPPTASPEFRSFVASCLQRDPRRRPTAAQLLRHPFITRRAAAEPGAPPDLSYLRIG